MTIEAMAEAFERHDEEFLRFERIERKRSGRPDLHAFLLLDELVPGLSDIVSAAEHDEIFIGVEAASLAAVVTEEQIRDLVRCGVRWHEEFECLALFV